MTSTHSRPRLVIYDLDGTLVDAFDDIANGVNHALRKAGIAELPMATIKSYVGDGARMLIRRCLGEAHADRFDEIYPDYADFYLNNPASTVRPYPGVLETLERLRALGIRQAVLSNKMHPVTVQTCGKLGIAERVDAVWGEDPSRPRKPDAEALLRILRQFNVEAQDALMVGDGPADHEVARAAGVRMIAVSYGLLPRDQALVREPFAVIDSLPELLDVIAGLAKPEPSRA